MFGAKNRKRYRMFLCAGIYPEIEHNLSLGRDLYQSGAAESVCVVRGWHAVHGRYTAVGDKGVAGFGQSSGAALEAGEQSV